MLDVYIHIYYCTQFNLTVLKFLINPVPKSREKPMAIHLFSPLMIKNVTFKNRIVLSPMCQYSSDNGFANDWHFVHLGSRALGGAGLVITEATAVTKEGRISPQDLGIWSDEHIAGLTKLVQFITEHGAVAGIQLAHAGRKASTKSPWLEGPITVSAENGGWQPVAPSALAFDEGYLIPHELTLSEITVIKDAFVQAAQRALKAGFKVIEIHAAHGYLLHEFLSPLSNQRQDQYGGDFENRIRLLLETVDAIKTVWPAEYPLWVRISATDWAEGGWNITESVKLCRQLKAKGIDLIDTSSGGSVPHARIPVGPGYQTIFAEQIRREANIATGAVGLITAPAQADQIIRTGQADMVLIAREMLRDPYWPLRAAKELGHDTAWPVQYGRVAK